MWKVTDVWRGFRIRIWGFSGCAEAYQSMLKSQTTSAKSIRLSTLSSNGPVVWD